MKPFFELKLKLIGKNTSIYFTDSELANRFLEILEQMVKTEGSNLVDCKLEKKKMLESVDDIIKYLHSTLEKN